VFSPFPYLGESVALCLVRHLKGHIAWVERLYSASHEARASSQALRGWELYRMTIAMAKRLLRAEGLEIMDPSNWCVPTDVAKWPIVGESLSRHAWSLLRESR
jgi:hypothetical protein